MHEIRNWDDLRLFLAVLKGGTFLHAAEQLMINQSTISRRVADLEIRLGTKLFDRSNKGVRLTPAGRSIRDAVFNVETAIFKVERGVAGIDREMRGAVKISITEGLAYFWLGPKLLEFQRQFPGLLIEIDATSLPRDLTSREADIALRYGRPEQPDYRIRKVASLPMRAYASQAYFREFGMPQRFEDLKNHYFVTQDNLPPGGLWKNWQHAADSSRGIVFRSNSSMLVAQAANTGYGIALLPTYAPDYYQNLSEIPLVFGPPLELWALTHETTGSSARVRVTLDHIYRLFEEDRYRYFTED